MARTILALGLATVGTVAAGCTMADLELIGMGNAPRETEVVQVREPLVLEVERPKGEAPQAGPEAPKAGDEGEFRVPLPKAGPDDAPYGYAKRGEGSVGRRPDRDFVFGRPWAHPLSLGLPAYDPADLQWSVQGAGRRGFGLPAEPPPVLRFSTEGTPPAEPAKPEKPSPEPQPEFSDR